MSQYLVQCIGEVDLTLADWRRFLLLLDDVKKL